MGGSTKLMSSGAGGVILTTPGSIAADVTVNLPTQNCTLGIQGPAFSAYLSSNQTVSANSYTKINFDVEDFDTNNNFSSGRFTPTVAGYYQVNAAVGLQTSANSLITIYKNGSVYLWGSYVTNDGANVTVSGIVYCNGSTDYIEIYAFTSGTSFSGAATPKQTYFQGALVRAA